MKKGSTKVAEMVSSRENWKEKWKVVLMAWLKEKQKVARMVDRRGMMSVSKKDSQKVEMLELNSVLEMESRLVEKKGEWKAEKTEIKKE